MRLFRLITAVCLSVLLGSKALAAPTKDSGSIFLGLGIGYTLVDFNTYQEYPDYSDSGEVPAVALNFGLLISNTHKVYFSVNSLTFGELSIIKKYITETSDLTAIIYAINYDYLMNYSPEITFLTGFGVGMGHYKQYIDRNDSSNTQNVSWKKSSLDSKELTASINIGMEVKTGDAWTTSLDARYYIASNTRMFGDEEENLSNGSNPITNKDIIGPQYDIPSVLVFSITFSRYF